MPGCRVYLSVADNPARKTKYDLVAVEKVRADGSALLINMDSQIVNDVAGEWLPVSGLFSPQAVVRREVTYGKSRFDFYIEDGDRKAFLEVKGCTLEHDGRALFPDAPTERGIKHLKVVYSQEEALSPTGWEEEAAALGKRQIPGSVAFVPGAAGLILAGEVIKDIALK